MNWAQASIIAGLLVTVGGLLWRSASAWTKKAIAIGEKAEAERAATRELGELRVSFAKFMERMQEAETEIKIMKKLMEERERARRDTQGIPVRSDGE